jgi:hypothetical protein
MEPLARFAEKGHVEILIPCVVGDMCQRSSNAVSGPLRHKPEMAISRPQWYSRKNLASKKMLPCAALLAVNV